MTDRGTATFYPFGTPDPATNYAPLMGSTTGPTIPTVGVIFPPSS